MVRKGLGRGKGKGYKNLAGRDPKVHSDSAKGRKQPQFITHIPEPKSKVLNTENLTWEEMEKIYGKLTAKDFVIENISPDFFGENVSAEIDKNGDIVYPNGLGGAIKELGGRKVSKSEIKQLMMEDEEGYVDVEEFLNSKQSDNTYNYDPPLTKTYNYGTFETEGGKSFISFKTHLGGDVRGNYSDSVLFEITDIDSGTTGDPSGDILILLSPRLYIRGNFKGKSADYDYLGGGSGFDTSDTSQPDIEEEFGTFFDKYEQYANQNFGI